MSRNLCVNFPVSDPRYRDTGEGGMFVMLIVVPSKRRWGCCGAASAHLSRNEVLIGTAEKENRDQMVGDQQVYPMEDLLAKGGPDDRPGRETPWQWSRPLYACLTIGATEWSGYDEAAGAHWRCRRTDLTPRGLRLLSDLTALYRNLGRVEILTWLDT